MKIFSIILPGLVKSDKRAREDSNFDGDIMLDPPIFLTIKNLNSSLKLLRLEQLTPLLELLL
jgi:hypothetical protein